MLYQIGDQFARARVPPAVHNILRFGRLIVFEKLVVAFGELWLGTSFADLSHARWPNNLAKPWKRQRHLISRGLRQSAWRTHCRSSQKWTQ